MPVRWATVTVMIADMDHQPVFAKKVTSALVKRCAVAPADRLLVAVSGGADSVALLRALEPLRHKRGYQLALAVGHVQHHLRSEAQGEAQFVKQLASDLHLPFFQEDLHPPYQPLLQLPDASEPSSAVNIEHWARQERYRALGQMAQAFDARLIATAHHGDDQLETVLMRLLRGSSLRGLGGMKWRRPLHRPKPGVAKLFLIRPMLGTSHQEAIRYLQSLGQGWCEDPTNHDGLRVRSALRATAVPALKQIAPHVMDRLTDQCQHLQALAQWYEQEVMAIVERDVQPADGQWQLRRSLARAYPPALLHGVLRAMLHQAGAPADQLAFRQIDQLAQALCDQQGGQRQYALARGTQATISWDLLTVQPAH